MKLTERSYRRSKIQWQNVSDFRLTQLAEFFDNEAMSTCAGFLFTTIPSGGTL